VIQEKGFIIGGRPGAVRPWIPRHKNGPGVSAAGSVMSRPLVAVLGPAGAAVARGERDQPLLVQVVEVAAAYRSSSSRKAAKLYGLM